MGKDHSEKKVKKEKKEKRAEENGVVKQKKEKKQKKSKAIDALEAELDKSELETSIVRVDTDGDVKMDEAKVDAEPKLLGALVPFANPLAEDPKEVKKILRTVKKSAKTKTLRRGVKEVVKALRKSELAAPSASKISDPAAICIIAADISPMDVISHIPVLCEDHSIPYIYIKSRAELGEASATKRPTSVVMVAKERVSKKASKEIKEEDVAEFQEAYGELIKLVNKAAKGVRK